MGKTNRQRFGEPWEPRESQLNWSIELRKALWSFSGGSDIECEIRRVNKSWSGVERAEVMGWGHKKCAKQHRGRYLQAPVHGSIITITKRQFNPSVY